MSLLPWLPRHDDLGGAIRGLRSMADPSERLAALIALAGHDRDATATGRLDRILGECLASPGLEGAGEASAVAGLRRLRLAILPSHTVDHLVPAIRVAGLGRGLALEVTVGTYGLHRQALLVGDPALEAFAPDLVLLALDATAVLPRLPLASAESEVEAAIGRAVGELRQLWRGVRDRYGARPVQQLLLPTSPSLFGSFDRLVPASPAALVDRLNLAIGAAAREDGALVLDLASQMPERDDGCERFDPVRWHQGKLLINPPFAPVYGECVARIAAAAAGLSRKCLVLDLDNTLWGGVIGDDGIEGIRLGQGSAEGEAYAAFQAYAAGLAERGVILAVCSKNDEAVARAAFDSHPEMVLRSSDVACFRANWEDKPGNIRRIAETLRIGVDSMVFIDDNPAERAIVRRELPRVAVPELPDDVSGYAATVAAAGYFEAAMFTAEDLVRVRSYAADAERAAVLNTATDMEGFLRSLEMRLAARPIAPVDLTRAAQLINKSNQFNLTTVRRSEEDLRVFAQDPGSLALCYRLVDRFGDNGLIGVVLAREDEAFGPGQLLLDTWLMSCRVLGRQVEAAVLGHVAQAAAARGASALIGEYRPSGRNGMVAEHYPGLGFVPIAPPAGVHSGACFWRLDLAAASLPPHHIQLELTA